ncbi:MAG: trypsin-like peptidase domain-containing protein [Oscillospiraceae bacterium]|nr:trypsin-like peptidase domain-containing protein [Oscillospiraceae bacterium]
MSFEKRNTDSPWDPWEQDTYQTGKTTPPKSHGGLVAVLLVLVILLCGIVSVLGLLNVRLFAQIKNQKGSDESMLRFSAADPTDATQSAAFYSNDPAIVLETTPAGVENIPQEGGLSLQEIYAKAIDSVVSISCSASGGSSSGTGVVLSADGYLVTNYHVVEGAAVIYAQFTDGRKLEAQIVGMDEISDLAVLQVAAADLSPAQFGDSGVLRVGDSVVAIGDPLGTQLRGTMTDGIVSAINRDILTEGRTMTLIQTNAALNSGNSGGPLLNCYGQVIGINTMKIGDYVSSAGVEGLGFAIPATTVQEIVNQILAQGYVSGRPTLGITGEGLSTFYQMYYRLPAGLYITQVEENSSAASVGLQPGDVLLSIDETRIQSVDTLKSVLYSHQVGDTVQAVIYRSGRRYQVELTVDEAR